MMWNEVKAQYMLVKAIYKYKWILTYNFSIL